MSTRKQADQQTGCSRIETVPGFLLDELSPQDKTDFAAHLAKCELCAGEVESMRSAIVKLRQLPQERSRRDLAAGVIACLPPGSWKSGQGARQNFLPFPLLLKIAAAIVAVVGLAAVLATYAFKRNASDGRPVANVATQPDAGNNITPAVVAAVRTPTIAREKGLDWLQRAQTADGSWGSGQTGSQKDYATGVSSLALLAFMDGNADVFRGRYASTVRKGIEYLVKSQDSQGLIGPRVSTAPYNEGLATMALLNACSHEQNETWRAAVEKSLKFMCSSQLPSGGWGYLKSADDVANSSASIWPLQALIRADNMGFDGLRPNIDRGLTWLQGAVNDDGFMGYTRADDLQYGPDTMTAAGIVCFLRDNKGSQQKAVRSLLPALRRIAARQDGKTDFYRTFFVAEAVALVDKAQSPEKLAVITGKLAALQNVTGATDGSWDASDQWGSVGGRVYSTAMATLALKCN
ncbi:MAG: hypothetical protein C0404_11240 [Verrucomicrobia bacterium]|nr:hypothetical protein [Verrucomicrobiota bacterium]